MDSRKSRKRDRKNKRRQLQIEEAATERQSRKRDRNNEQRKLQIEEALRSSLSTPIATKTNSIATNLLLKDAKNGYKKGNFVCSPASLESLLAMLAAGAKGQTLEQLLGFLGFESFVELVKSPKAKLFAQLLANGQGLQGGPDISSANGVWIDKRLEPILPSYQETLMDLFKANAESVDFENEAVEFANKINSWASEKTKGLIKNVVRADDFSKETKIVLANAIYFKGLWESPFDEGMTEERDFHLMNGETVSVPFMTSKITWEYGYGLYEHFKVLQIKYENGDDSSRFSMYTQANFRQFSMYIFLPQKRNELQSLLEQFHSDHTLFHQRFHLIQEPFDALWIPKFKISHKFEAKDVMKEMGLTLPFEPMNKELTGIVDSQSPNGDLLYVSRIFQNSCIEVDERGTKAAAFGFPEGRLGCLMGYEPPPPPTFVADHPFMFMIREDISQAVFFIGVVLNPKNN